MTGEACLAPIHCASEQLITTIYSLITGALAPDPTRVGRGECDQAATFARFISDPTVWGGDGFRGFRSCIVVDGIRIVRYGVLRYRCTSSFELRIDRHMLDCVRACVSLTHS